MRATTQNDLYDRQQFPEPNGSLDILLIGAGGLGTAIAHHLAMSGSCRTLTVYDDDTLESSNYNRLPYIQNGNQAKVDKLKDRLGDLRTRLPITVVDAKMNPLQYEEDEVGEIDFDYVILAADGEQTNEDAADLFADYIEGGRFLKVGADSQVVSIRNKPIEGSISSDNGDNGDYSDIWYGTCNACAIEVVNLVVRGVDMNEVGCYSFGEHYRDMLANKQRQEVLERLVSNLGECLMGFRESTIEHLEGIYEEMMYARKDIVEGEGVNLEEIPF